MLLYLWKLYWQWKLCSIGNPHFCIMVSLCQSLLCNQYLYTVSIHHPYRIFFIFVLVYILCRFVIFDEACCRNLVTQTTPRAVVSFPSQKVTPLWPKIEVLIPIANTYANVDPCYNELIRFVWYRAHGFMMASSNENIFHATGVSSVTGEFPSQRPVTRMFELFFDLRLNKRLSKQSKRRWFETPSWSLWRHCNGNRPRSPATAFRSEAKGYPMLLTGISYTSNGVTAWIND